MTDLQKKSTENASMMDLAPRSLFSDTSIAKINKKSNMKSGKENLQTFTILPYIPKRKVVQISKYLSNCSTYFLLVLLKRSIKTLE